MKGIRQCIFFVQQLKAIKNMKTHGERQTTNMILLLVHIKIVIQKLESWQMLTVYWIFQLMIRYLFIYLLNISTGYYLHFSL